MTNAETPDKRGLRRLFVDATPLKVSPAFARLWVGNSIAQIGSQMTIVAVGLHVYALTGSTFAVSLVALWAIGPMIVAGLLGGALADMFDRRTVSLLAASAAWIAIGSMTTIAFLGVQHTWPYYLLAAINSASATIVGAARGAIYPRLLPSQLLPAAAALHGITMGVSVTVGPALAGVLVAAVGVPWTFLLDVTLFTAGFLGLWGLPSIKPQRDDEQATEPSESSTPARPPLIAAVLSIGESIRFLRHAPNVRATFIWDILAMTFGQPRVVFPAAGALVLGGGAVTVGALTASYAIGSLLSSLLSGPLGTVRRQGRAVTIAIVAFGISTAGFGLVLLTSVLAAGYAPFEALPAQQSNFALPANMPAIVLACVALAAAGASDNVSAVFRSTIMQTAAPDKVIGRMQGFYYVVVTGGPRIGDLMAGMLATVVALWAPALIGGMLVALIMLVLLRTATSFTHYDSRNPTP